MKHFENVMRWMNGAGVVWVFAIMFMICADIVGRNLFDSPIAFVPEAVALSLVGCVFLQLAFAVHENKLTRAEFLIARVAVSHPGFANGWYAVMAVMAAAIFALMTIGAWPDFTRAFATSEFAGVEGIFKISVWPIKLIIVIGAAVTALECVLQLVRGRSHQRSWWSIIVPVVLAILAVWLWRSGVSQQTIGGFMILAVLALIALGTPIAIALLITGFLGLAILKQDFGVATRTLSLAAEGTVSEYVFAPVPLFVLMGLFVQVSDIGRDAFRAAQQLFGWITGGLGVATVAANAIFAAITGIAIAAAAIFTKIAVPEMVRQGYTAKFAVGLTAGSSVLGMLIPPSLLLIIYGVIAEVSIGALFIAAIIPGILLAAAFAVGVILMAWLAPGFVGDVRRSSRRRTEENSEAGQAEEGGNPWVGMLPVIILIVVVLGGIYGGYFTPTEAGAAGAFVAMLLAIMRRKLSWPKLWGVIRETGTVSVTILFLIICASTFSMMLTLTELPQDIGALLGSGLSMFTFLLIYLLLLIVIGMVLDSTSMMLILLPLALPVVVELGGNLIWFGVVTVVGVNIGLLTPPLGLSVYVIKSSLDDDSITLGTIFHGAFPFVLITLAVTIALMIWPELSLVLL
ncbi:MAG TPA: TRAP transporter large permease subunit [Gammaproteobacteria bacterium]|nr:TRAP transporter large permease subunit [Gammaproteobacteria bacterium]